MMEEKHSPPPFAIDDGDLQLLVTYSGKRVAVGVSSHAMSLASPVWKKILHPPFSKLPSAEAGNDDKQFDFSDDDWEALLVLLHIVHLQFSKVPDSLAFETIVQVAVLCDKYDCVGLVKPWLSLWYEETHALEPGHELWLFIAWVLGKKEIFQDLATKLVNVVKTNFKGDCLTSTGEILASQMPIDIIGKFVIIYIYNKYPNRYLFQNWIFR